MKNFKSALNLKLLQSDANDFGIDNYDEYRYGPYPYNKVQTPKKNLVIRIKSFIKQTIKSDKESSLYAHVEFLKNYENRLQNIYSNLSEECQNLLVELIAYRLLGYQKVKLKLNNTEFWKAVELGNSLEDQDDIYDPHFMHFILKKCHLKKIGYNLKFYFLGMGVAIDFILEQYSFKSLNKTIVEVEKDDVVLDLGACWGDTAMYFASKAGNDGKVYSFEFIPENIKLFNLNINLNPHLKEQISLIQNPVSNKSGENIYYKDHGPGSTIQFKPFDEQTGQTTTISIDDFVKNNLIEKVDFIKMDIEGAELLALEGAIETIKKFKPKLAITIYHSIEDFVNIPNWILGLDIGYEIFIGHYTIHSEETVCFAKHTNK